MARLPARHARALARVRNGADVYSYELAGVLREIERQHPGLISIGPAQMVKHDGTGIEPYFGAIATPAGRKALRGAAA